MCKYEREGERENNDTIYNIIIFLLLYAIFRIVTEFLVL